MSNVLSRSRNPTGIRLSKNKAKQYYSPDNPAFTFGESTVTGTTPSGFVEFGDDRSGVKAALHDYGVKKDKGFTLGQFIEAHTSGDSTGIANHKINIPAILKRDGIEADLTTLVADIPTDAFMNAVTQSEGGLENRAQFKPVFADVLADTASVDDPLVRSLTEEPPTGEQFTPLSSEELAKMTPEERNAYNNRAMDAWAKSSKSFSDLTGDKSTDQTDPITEQLTADNNPNLNMPASVRNSMDFQTAEGGRMFGRFPEMSIKPTPPPPRPEVPVGERPFLDENIPTPDNTGLDLNLDEFAPKRRPKLPTRLVSTEGSIDDDGFIISPTDPNNTILPSGEDINAFFGAGTDKGQPPTKQEVLKNMQADRQPKVKMPKVGTVETEIANTEISNLNDVFVSPEEKQKIEEVKGFIDPTLTNRLPSFNVPKDFAVSEPVVTEGAGVSTDTPTEAPTEAPTEDPTVNNSIFARLGRAIKDNPEIALSGAESLGSLLASIGQSRGQRKEDARVRKATGRSNLISALTGGKVRPQVTSEAPDLGLLGRIGQGLKVGGSTVRDAMEKQATFGLKEGELQRKIEKDASIAARHISLNNLDEAKAQNYIDRISIGRSAEERKMLEAQIKAYLGIKKEERLSATDKWKQELANKQIDIKQAYLELSREDQIEAHKQAVRALDIKASGADSKMIRAKAYANSIEKKAEKDLKIDEKTARDDFRKTVSDVRKEVGFLDSERGTLNVYRGLESAYANWETTGFNAAAATAVFNFYQQLFDPATVREGDLNMQKEAQGYIQSLAALKQRSVGEGFVLSKEQIRRMKSLADQFFKSAQDASASQINTYLDVLYEDDAEELNKYHRYYNSLFGPKYDAKGNPISESWFGVGQPTVNEQSAEKDKGNTDILDKADEKIG